MIYLFGNRSFLFRSLFRGVNIDASIVESIKDVRKLKPGRHDIIIVDRDNKEKFNGAFDAFLNVFIIQDDDFDFTDFVRKAKEHVNLNSRKSQNTKLINRLNDMENVVKIDGDITIMVCDRCNEEMEVQTRLASFTKYCKECRKAIKKERISELRKKKQVDY